MTSSAKQNDLHENRGVLYVVSTPIGNLQDITLRALTVLKDVDIIAAENIGHTRGLLAHHGIDTPVEGYRRENQRTRGPELVRRMQTGKKVALVTDAGTPGISDPGNYLIDLAAAAGLSVSPIPGPSAVSAALSVSGFPADEFIFAGFLPPKAGKRKGALKRLASDSRTVVFFEAPHRIKAALADLKDIMGDRPMVMLREMTKVFEEVRRGTPGEVLAGMTDENTRGEFTLVVSGADKQGVEAIGEEVQGEIRRLLAEEKLGVKDAALRLSEETGLPYRRIYREGLAAKGNEDRLKPMERVGKFKLRNTMGLHARAAAKVVELANQYTSRLYLKKDGVEVDGSSILSILTLSCPKGTEIEARVLGEDCDEFMIALGRLFEDKFGEGK
ncbi:MAG: 16S rRNA (cytidine(1402)-2'-O)-methyltransferase [Deltaproteobacteria bacterium]|nr:16S rRNA (cytidine(1402)-2'-O)-methyltransferase [Deltaproteobacteria bacterium]MBW2283147.1 16S rRNA (cytidine(1402)-2'-O)-methyltransferase [Deltaproteobacteria bacterium]